MSRSGRTHDGRWMGPEDILTPVEPAQSKFASEAESMVRAFAERWQVKPPHFEDYNTMSGYLYPGSLDANRLAAACQVHSLFFFIDDLFFDTQMLNPADYGIDPAVGRDPVSARRWLLDLMSLFRGAALPSEPTLIQRAFHETGAALRVESPGDWFEAFVEGVEDYIRAVTSRDEDLIAQKRSLESVEAFLAIRERDTGGLHTCQLIEWTDGCFLRGDQRADLTLQRLTLLCFRMASLVNDVYSYHKDVIKEGSEFNLITVIMRHEGLNFEAAQGRAVEIINGTTLAFFDLKEQAAVEGLLNDPKVQRYVAGLAALMAGNKLWHATSGRYRVDQAA